MDGRAACGIISVDALRGDVDLLERFSSEVSVV